MFTRRREQLLRSVAAGKEGITPSDPDWQYCELLVDTVSADAQDNRTFDDASTGNHSITANGDVTQGTFSPFSPGGWAVQFDGTDDYFSMPNDSDFAFGTADFAIEFWLFADSSQSSHGLVAADTTGTGYWASLIAGNYIYWQSKNGSTNLFYTNYTAYYDKWTHVVFTRVSSTTRLFLDGVEVASASDSTNYSGTSGDIDFGCDLDNSAYLKGRMSNVRIRAGTGYTSVTIPTAPYENVTNTVVLTAQDNRFVENASSKTITFNSTPRIAPTSPFGSTTAWTAANHGGSGYFDGSGDYLSVAGSTDHDLGTGDFCIELWVYPLEALADHIWVSSATGTAVQLGYDTGNGPRYLFFYAGANRLTSSADVISPYMWNHVVVCRSGSDMSLYSNGIRRDTTTYSGGVDLNPLDVGRWQSGGWDMKCFHGDVRIVKGDSVYDPTATTLTVPTAPLTAITNTVLLLNFTNAGIYDATGKNNIGLYGATETDTAVTKFAATSLKSPSGTTDYATVVGQSFPDIGAADFTFITWVYFDSLGQQVVWDTRPTGVGGGYPLLYMTNSNALSYNISGNRITTSALSAGTWYWVVVTRENRVNRMWLDGTYIGAYTDASTFITPEDRPRIGGNGYSPSSDHLKGHLESYQWYVGKALYTGTGSITVPTTVPAKRGE